MIYYGYFMVLVMIPKRIKENKKWRRERKKEVVKERGER